MLAHEPSRQLFVRDGTSQQQRALAPLQPDYFALAGMPFADLLALAVRYAGLVKFYQLDNTIDGDWASYFSADETIIIARILSTRLGPAQARFDAWRDGAGEHRQHSGASAQHWQIERLPMTPLALDMDGWITDLALSEGGAGRKLHALLASVIDSLCDDAGGFAAFLPAPQLRLGPHWRAPAGAAAAAVSVASLKYNYYAFVKAVEMVQQEAERQLPASLLSGEHDPGVGLLIAFIEMAGRLDARLNRFTAQHLDFYYRRILRAAPLPAVPDHTYLVTTPCEPGGMVEIPAGTEFVAKPDPEGPELVYQADTALLVSDARVRALQTLFFNRDRNVSPETEMDHGGAAPAGQAWPSHAWSQQLAPAGDEVCTDPALLRAMPLMGAPKTPTPRLKAADARLGFALASNVLLMREGRRHISVRLQLAGDEIRQRLNSLIDVILSQKHQPGNARQSAAPSGEIERQAAFLRIFRSLFNIALTGPGGWVAVPDYLPSGASLLDPAGDGGAVLLLEFELPLEAPPVVPYSPALHGEAFEAGVPILRLVLNPDSYVYPYGLLRDVTLAAATIEVAVSGYRQLSLNNQIGQLSPATPFQPFGPIPTVGSYLIVGAGEAAGKQLTHFALRLEWGELPADSGGFKDYYQHYPQIAETDQYQASVAVLVDGVWVPDPEGAPRVPLFRDDYARTASRRVEAGISLSCDRVLHRLKASPGPLEAKPNGYSAAARDGYFKFTLAGPRFAFGHRDYPQALAAALQRNMRDKSGRFQAAMPAPPYTPVINAVTADYRAVARIALHQGSVAPAAGWNNTLFHLHPQGWQAISAAPRHGATLLPSYPDLGHLHIGLTTTELNAALTLLFHLQDDSLPGPPAEIRWSYLANNNWKPLPLRCILSDTTDGFMTSGVVALLLPPDISLDNTVMPAGLYWLRVSGSEQLRNFCSLYGVYTQALLVRRQAAGMQAARGVTLPAASIRRSRSVIAGLGKVVQVIDSRGGRLCESDAQMHTRIAERLRHKGRAVTPADYETLVLQQFPEVYKVKCFPNLVTKGDDAADWVRASHVLIVALPHLAAGATLGHRPQLSGKLVADIGRYLRALAPPVATISVEHPVYEQIQVRCTVRLRPGLSGGHYIARLNDDISRFLSPWSEVGNRIHFGWSVRLHEIESYILELDYIAEVSGCSMLRIAPTAGDRYLLSDSARPAAAAITPRYPWSVAVPIERHLIEVSASDGTPQMATLDTLDIGSTFIIAQHDKDPADGHP